jgi:1-acyl-sn-glycerol-3-phosphate acyltransferase
MAEPQIMSPQEYGRSVLGYAEGQSIKGKELAKFRDQYARYVQSASKSFTPTAIAVTNPVNTNQVIPVLTTSPNSVQPLPQTQFKPAVGKDGKAYNYNPMTGTYAPALIEGTTNQFETDPKSNNLADLMAAMGGGASAPMEEESPGVLSRIFGGVASSPAPTPTPTPTPAPTPAMTNAPAPVAAPTPAVFSAARYKQMTGQDLPPGDYTDANGRPFSVR